MTEKIHYRTLFNSVYLSSVDIVDPIALTITKVIKEKDKSKRTGEFFWTAYFAEKEIRQGEPLLPMIVNASNCRVMSKLTGAPFPEDWKNVSVTVYADPTVKRSGEVVGGLKISTERPIMRRQELKPNTPAWAKAVARYKKDNNLEAVLKHMDISDENQAKIKEEAKA